MKNKYSDSLYGKGGRLKSAENIQNWINLINTLVPDDVKPNPLREGEKVKINLDWMKSYPSYETRNPRFIEFIENHADTIFTVEFEESQKEKKMSCVLKEEESPLKWIFYEADLIRIEEIK